ncbi:hypothetical protein ACXR2T_06260 [Leucobacter sp. HY1910]
MSDQMNDVQADDTTEVVEEVSVSESVEDETIDTDTVQDDTAPDDDDRTDPRVKKARDESARYRRALRDAETTLAERDTLIESLQRDLIASQLQRVKAEAIPALGRTYAEFFVDGTIDLEALAEFEKEGEKTFGIRRFQGGGHQGSGGRHPSTEQPTFGALLRR